VPGVRVSLRQPLPTSVSRGATGAAAQRTEDHLVEWAPRFLSQIYAVAVEQSPEVSMHQYATHCPDFGLLSGRLARAQHWTSLQLNLRINKGACCCSTNQGTDVLLSGK
jgi:hypothetical protein